MKAFEQKIKELEIKKEESSTLLPSYRCSMAEEIDEGDLQKHPIYSKFDKAD